MKTNILKNLKQGMFLILAVLATFVGYSQPNQNPTIGGSKTPDTGGLIDIGGRQDTPINPFKISATETQCIFATVNEIGGGKGTSSDTGQFDSPINSDTGGGKSSDGGLNPGFPIIDIGGRSTGGDFADVDTGGKNSTGGLEIDCPLCPDTGGGNGGKSTTGEYAYSDIGGRDSGGGLNPINDIGGRGDTGTGAIVNTGGRTPGGIGFYQDEKSNLSMIERFGCVLRPTYTPD
jgi:hypothetical protein